MRNVSVRRWLTNVPSVSASVGIDFYARALIGGVSPTAGSYEREPHGHADHAD